MKNIEFSPPDISQAEIDGVVEVLKSGWITTGKKTKTFEKEIAKYTGCEKAVCLNSATAAMELTLKLLGVGEGDEVITSAYTYTASASVICHVGAKPVLVDVAKDSFEMDYDKLKKAITKNTKVIIPVDIAGVMCDYDKIFKIIEEKKKLFTPSNDIQKAFGRVVVLADAAHSFGADYKGKKAGNVADFTSFSFHAIKNLTTGEGGAVCWNSIPGFDNEDIYKQYMLFSLHGQNKDALAKTKLGVWEYDIIDTYYKCNMTDIVAAIGLSQLERYDGMLEKRKTIIGIYDSVLKDCDIQLISHYKKNRNSSGHLYLTRVLGISSEQRNEIIDAMGEKGIATNVHYKPLPMMTAYKKLGFDIKNYPNAYDMFKNEITLPLHSLLTEEQAFYVAYSFKEIVNQYTKEKAVSR